jgi:Bacteriophage CI repressor helix-turn-helix domain
MDEPVRVFIERAKAEAGVITDEELAKKLGRSKQAIASWRRRGSVPLAARAEIMLLTATKALASRVDALPLLDLKFKHFRALVKADSVVNAITIFFWSSFISGLKNPPSARTMLSIAAAQTELISIVRLSVLPVFEDGDEETLFRFVNQHHALQTDYRVARLLKSLDLDGNEVTAK